MNWLEVSNQLAQEAKAVAALLLPNGKRCGSEWMVGSVRGEAGASLKVCIAGRKAGVWHDFAEDIGGDLIDLWAATKGLTLKQAFESARDYLGIVEPKFTAPIRTYTRPVKPPAVHPSGRVLAYLTEQRKRSHATVQAFKVAASKEDDAILFPYLRDGELINVKHLALEREAGKKKTWQARDAEPCLFGWDLIPDNAKSVLIAEGEIDAMSLYEYRIPALSVNQGAGNHQWIDADFDRLERFQEIFLWFDADEVGRKGAREAAHRLGLERCRIVEFHLKDANEALMQSVPKEDVLTAFGAAQRIEHSDLKTPRCYVDQVIEMFEGAPRAETGAYMPWPALQDRVRLRPTEFSLWTGFNGHGKSDLLGHVLVDLVQQGERVCLFSGEIKPKILLHRLATQACATSRPTSAFARAALDWMEGAIWVYDHIGSIHRDKLLDTFRYAAKRYRVTHFLVDSLLKCGLAEDDYTGQKRFAEALCDFKNEFDVHMHLVAHARKGENEMKAPGKMDVRGAGALTDLADNVFTVWRNKRKEAEGMPAGEGEEDAMLYCHKQRATGHEGALRLWFDPNSLHFKQSTYWRPKPYFDFSILRSA